MSLAIQKDIFDEVNQKIDVQALLDLLDWHPDKAQLVGRTLKCYCPVHKGAYSTLVIDVRRKTFRCTIRACAASRGGGLVDLWAMARDLEPLQAALDLCERLQLDVDTATISNLSNHFFEEAEAFFVKRSLVEAKERVGKALELDAENPDARLLLAKIYTEEEDTEKAKAEYFRVAETYMRRDDAALAQEMRRRVLELDPRDSAARVALAEQYQAQFEPQRAVDVYEEICALNTREKRERENAAWYSKIIEVDPTRTETRERLARLLVDEGMTDDGVEQLRLLARHYQAQENPKEAMRALDRILAVAPSDIPALEERAVGAVELGETEVARTCLRGLADLCIDREELDKAQAALDRLVELDPGDFDTQERLATLLMKRGEGKAARDAFLRLSELALEQNHEARAIEPLERVREMDFRDRETRRRLADLYERVGRVDDAIEEYHNIAELAFDDGSVDEGTEFNRKVARLAGDNFEHRLRAANRYEHFSLASEALDEYREAARAAAAERDVVAQRKACDEGLRLAPDDLELMQLRFEAVRDQASPDEIVTAAKILVERQVKEGHYNRAEETILESLALAPEDLELRQRLFDLYYQQKRLKDLEPALKEFAGLLRDRDQTTKAVVLCRRFLELAPKTLDIRRLLADLYGHMGDEENQVEALRILADLHVAASEWTAARAVLDRMLEMRPDDLKALRRLAEVIHHAEDFAAALPTYLRVVERLKQTATIEEICAEYDRLQDIDPENTEIRRSYADYLAESNEWEKAKTQYLELADLYHGPRGDPESAVAILELVAERDPSDLALRQHLAGIHREKGEVDEAIAILEEVADGYAAAGEDREAYDAWRLILDLRPDHRHSHEALVEFHARRGEADEAIEHCEFLVERLKSDDDLAGCVHWYERILHLDRDRLDILQACAETWEELGDTVKACERYRQLAHAYMLMDSLVGDSSAPIGVLRKVIALEPADFGSAEQLIELLITDKRSEEAKAEYDRLVDLCLGQDNTEQAESYLKQRQGLDPKDISVAERLGRLYEIKNNPALAANEYLKVCEAAEAKRDYAHAIEVLTHIKDILPADLSVRERLIALYSKQEDEEGLLRESYELASEAFALGEDTTACRWAKYIGVVAPDRIDARIDAARLLFQNRARDAALSELSALIERTKERGQWDDALRAASAGAQLAPESVEMLAGKVQAYIHLERNEEALQGYRDLAELYRARGDNAAVETCYRDALTIAPESVECYESLLALYREQERVADAVDCLLTLCSLYEKENQFDMVLERRGEAIRLDPGRLGERLQQAELYGRLGRLDEMVSEYYALVEVYDQRGDSLNARRFLQRVLEHDPTDRRALTELIERCRDLDDGPRAIEYALALGKLREDEGDREAALAVYESVEGIQDNNVVILERIVELRRTDEEPSEYVGAIRRLAEALQGEGRFLEAADWLEKLLELAPDDIGILDDLAELRLEAEEPAKACERLMQALDICASQGRATEAIDFARRVLEIDAQHYDAHERLAGLLLETGERDAAERERLALAEKLEKAKASPARVTRAWERLLEIDPDKADYRARLARALEKEGQNERAVEEYLALADIHREKGERAAAVQFCRKALSLDEENIPAHEGLLAVHVDAGENDRAIDELQWLASKAMEQERLEDAEAHLQRGLAIDADQVALREQLVILYQTQGRIEEANTELLKIIEHSIAANDFDRAAQALEEAKDAQPDNVRIRRRLSEVYLELSESDLAVEELIAAVGLYLEQGLVGEARELSDFLLSSVSDSDELRERVARAYEDGHEPQTAAEMYVVIARRRRKDKDLEAAMDFSQRALALDPRRSEIREILAPTLQALGRSNEAVEQYAALSELEQKDGRLDNAVDALNQALQIRSDDMRLRERQLDLFREQGDREKEIGAIEELAGLAEVFGDSEAAIKWLSELVVLRSDDPAVRLRLIEQRSAIRPEQELVPEYLELIECYRRQKLVVEATDTFNRLLAIDPDNTEIREALVDFLLENNQSTRALNELMALTDIYESSQTPRRAADAIERAIELDGATPELHVRHSDLMLAMNRRGRAIESLARAESLYSQADDVARQSDMLERMLALDSQNTDIWTRFIDALFQAGRVEDAVEQASLLADHYIEREFLDQAESVYRLIIEHVPDDERAWESLIQTHLQIGLEEDLLPDYLALAEAQLKAGRVNKAVKTLKNVIDLDPSNLDARRRYIDVYLQIGIENDLVDDYAFMAEHVTDQKEADEWRRRTVALDPSRFPADAEAHENGSVDPSATATGTRRRRKTKSDTGPARREEMERVIENYRNILKINPSNASVRLQLADIYDQTQQEEEAFAERDRAAETLIAKGELEKGVAILEDLLEKRPEDARIRERLSKAALKRDAFSAIESALSMRGVATPRPDDNRLTPDSESKPASSET